MNCRAVKKAVWRQGAGELTESAIRHVAGCAACRGLVAEIRALDQVLREEATPDPGNAYWESFGSRLTERLEAGTQQVYRPSPVGVWRWRWARLWVPAVGVAMLAAFLGREFIEDRQVLEPVPTMEQKPAALGEFDASPSVDNSTDKRTATRSSEGEGEGVDVAAPEVSGPAGTVPERAISPPPESKTGESSPDDGTPTTRPAFVESSAEPTPDQTADDDEVWPERRIMNLGQVSSDTPGRPIDGEKRLADQDAFRVYERQMARSEISSETAGVSAMPGRLLEGPRIQPSSGFADSRTPAEAMRRFDEILELRSLIGDLQPTPGEIRTLEQRRRLCALWYRLGQIASEPMMVDSAIAVLGEYLQTLDETAGSDWFSKRETLIQRRQSMGL